MIFTAAFPQRRKAMVRVTSFIASHIACLACLVGAERTIAHSGLPAAADRQVDFVKDIQPIFAKACYSCHGRQTQESGLRLDRKEDAFKGGDSGSVIFAHESAKSRLIERVAGLDEDAGPMPPEGSGEPLSSQQVALLRAWIDQGASWPAEADRLWSLQAIVRPSIPVVKNRTWMRNEIDAFILEVLEREQVTPSPEADRATLIRRVYLDLVGLLPEPEEVRAFVEDQRPDYYERLVDTLLDSPHYGERWGRHWLDAARYADSDGYEKDGIRPFAWRYRDWVIEAHNRDMPFDVFSIQQIAGDLLAPEDPEFGPTAKIATGLHRNTLLNLEGGVDPEEDRVKRTLDRTNTTGTVWLGLTVGCANCHDHKYDPISQREYFQMYAFFNNMKETDIPVDAEASTVEQPDLRPMEMLPDDRSKVDVAAIVVSAETATTESSDEKRESSESKDQGEQVKAEAASPPKKKKKVSESNRRITLAMTSAQAVEELKNPRETYIHDRGDFLSKGATVIPGTLETLPPLKSRGKMADRLDFARWMFDPANPLTARVAANRLWQGHFGRGLVSTGEDFGVQGERPSHPALLDWLASELRERGWRWKHFHRLVVMSATYRQSSRARPELVQRDPYNTWLAKQNRIRVEAEIVRDLGLCVSGLLYPRTGGPSVRPPQPEGISEVTYSNSANWQESTGPDRYRRGMYVWFQRTSPYPSSIVFDAPEANVTCTRRERSNTPLQALTLLNDEVFVEFSQGFAKRMLAASPSPEGNAADARIRYGYELCLSRLPNDYELSVLRRLYDSARANSESSDKSGVSDQDLQACIAVARAMLNLDEFMTRE
jgi:hypothetical protein